MDVTATREHEAKVCEVLDLLTHPDSLAAMRPEMSDMPVVEEVDGGVRVEAQRWIHLPGPTDPLLSERIEVREHISWRDVDALGAARADVRTEIAGAPIGVVGTYVLEPTAGGCRSVVELQLGSGLAVLGGRLLASVRHLAVEHLETELDQLDDALRSRHR